MAEFGLRRTTGNRVYVNSVSRVRIPVCPSFLDFWRALKKAKWHKNGIIDFRLKKESREALFLHSRQIEGKGGAAELLDIHPNTLRNRMKKLNINANEYKSKN